MRGSCTASACSAKRSFRGCAKCWRAEASSNLEGRAGAAPRFNALGTLHQDNVVGKTAGYSPDLRVDLAFADNPRSPTLPLQGFQCQVEAVSFHFGIIADVVGIP